ncbi:GNAT family N-acetyltransferase [Enterococcus sp. DIV0242_7C1]|uniref:N-acetyltransferase domain-containing protein n=2 Tax=Candidatus Enterococcus dunnyi TaxID=1834192 RepID=A0A200JDD2_9ENTE|nr:MULTISPECIES: GNAT family N-acetyltransferase [unclassified Enterococcus]MBO0471806.1 GNAT family N-acetyltransferase [Enterococcus sp. DIV0242_7C1]OUZ34680.1 hypothetical protein A5889_000155 [Enterococcus sp. 9D6_DIV0238]
MAIEIKKLDKKDFGKAIDFAIEGMNFDKYIDNKFALRLYGRFFLYTELERSTQVLAAYMDDKLVGILMADIKNEPKHYSSIWRKMYIQIFEILMSILSINGADTYDVANKEMFEEYSKDITPDGEICFLATDPTIHRKGIGTILINEISKRERNKLIYLYTDDNCTYQFYEKMGFKRDKEKVIKMEIAGKDIPLTCLLYSKLL